MYENDIPSGIFISILNYIHFESLDYWAGMGEKMGVQPEIQNLSTW